MAKVQRRDVDLLGTTVAYEVTHSPNASEPRIDVDIHGVTVVIPESEAVQPAELLKENAAWVIEKKREYDAYRAQVPERNHEEGALWPYLGEEYEVVVERRPTSTVEESTNTLRLAKHHVEETSVKRALETLYRRKGREKFKERADTYAAAMGVEYDQIEIRNQRTKWGSCSTSGTLGLNWRLMMAPVEILNYIVVHEVAHLRESNHTGAFWSLVAEHDPDYEAHAEWLETNSTQLIFSEADL
jgi:predicted metal-dependent hydrolase